MAVRYAADKMRVIGKDRIMVHGKFRPNGASGIVAGSAVGWGWTAARTSAGLYTVTFDSPWPRLISYKAHARSADGVNIHAVMGDYSSSAGTMQIRTRRGSPVHIPLPLGAAREIASNDFINTAGDAGVLSLNTTPLLQRVNGATDKAARLVWAAGNVDEIQWSGIAVPASAETANAVTVNLWTEKDADANTVTIDVQAFAGKGDTEMGAATSTITQALARKTVTLAAADVGAIGASSFLNIALVPSAHAGDALHLYAASMEFDTLVDLASDADNEVSFEAIFANNPGSY